MSSKLEKERQKQIQDRCQRLLNQMLKDEDNKYCVDCDAKGPRWASWNIGVFLCIRCAGIHRNLGVHISRVKSVNLDTWTPQQVVSLQQMGNSRARAVYEANLPDNFRRPQTDSSLETFIRSKYERKKYIAREWIQPPLPKVNWDKELDEETEKLKKKKKEIKQAVTSVRTLSSPSIIPQALPKPQSTSSPKSSRIIQQNTIDLLGMNTPTKDSPCNKTMSSDSELFANFLDSPEITCTLNSTSVGPSSSSSSSTTTTRTAEEESFFNQSTIVTPNKQKQLTKDSILALYSNPGNYVNTTPPINNSILQSFNTQLNGLSVQGYNTPGQINVVSNLQNGMIAQNNGQFASGMNTVPPVATSTGFSSNPFYSMSTSQPFSAFSAQKNASNIPSSVILDTDNSTVDNHVELNNQMSAMNLNMQNANYLPTSANQQNGQFFPQSTYLTSAQQTNIFNHTFATSQQWQ